SVETPTHDLRESDCGSARFFRRELMLPVSNNLPTSLFEFGGSLGVPTLVDPDLLDPPRPILLWRGEVLRTSVPEAAVNEDADPCSAEEEVCLRPQCGLWPNIGAKPEAELVRGRP